MHKEMNKKLKKILLTVFIALLALGILFPLYFTLLIALKDPKQMAQGILSFPSVFHWDNFTKAIQMTNYFSALKNSLIVTVSVVLLTVFTNSFIGYVIARNWKNLFFKVLYFYFISAMFIPFTLIMLPIVKEMSMLGISNIEGLIFLYIIYGLPMNVFIYVGYVRTISTELEEAARIDGANTWIIFTKVIFPIMKPINATVAILTALWCWNDFMLPLVILGDKSEFTLPLTQYVFQSQFSTNYNLAFSSYLLVMVPILIVYIFLQKKIINGVMAGAIKG